MKNRFLYITLIIGGIFQLMFTSCKDSEDIIDNSVIISTRSISFPAAGNYPVSIFVTSDGPWKCDTPEWLTVTPPFGNAGRTEAFVEAAENYTDGILNKPREYTLKFTTPDIFGSYEVYVNQAGDKFRGIEPIELASLKGLEDDEAVYLKDLIVYSVTTNNLVVTDGQNFAYIKNASADIGDKIEILGSKFEEDNQPYVDASKLTVTGSCLLPDFEITDITNSADNFAFDGFVLVKAKGIYNGSMIKLEGQTNNLQIVDVANNIHLDDYKGHIVEIKGICTAKSVPVIKLIATEITDLGLNETIYFNEDFEWFNPWVGAYQKDGKNVSDNVGDKMYSGGYNPQAQTVKNSDGKSVWDILLSKGYEFASTKEAQAKKCLCLGVNYLKMGLTTYTVSMKLPKMPAAGDGVDNVHIQFDWTPVGIEGLIWDYPEIVVIVENDGKETQYPVPSPDLTDGESEYKWFRVDLEIKETITKDTRITIRNVDQDFPQTREEKGKRRYFIDNIKLYKPKDE